MIPSFIDKPGPCFSTISH